MTFQSLYVYSTKALMIKFRFFTKIWLNTPVDLKCTKIWILLVWISTDLWGQKCSNWSEVHLYQSNFTQIPYFTQMSNQMENFVKFCGLLRKLKLCDKCLCLFDTFRQLSNFHVLKALKMLLAKIHGWFDDYQESLFF